MKKHHCLSFFLFSLGLCAQSIQAADIQVESHFQPAQVPAGQHASYIIIVTGSHQTPQAEIPRIPGLVLRYVGGKQSAQIINGSTSIQSDYTFLVETSTPGEYTLPSFTLTIDGNIVEVPPATLVVGHFADTATVSPQRKPIELALAIEKETFYIGEMVPITLSLYIPSGIGGNVQTPYPIKRGDAFADYGFIQPEQTMTHIDDSPYQKFSWKTYISPLKLGAQTLEFNLDLMIAKPYEQPRNTIDDFFNRSLSSLMNNVFADKYEDISLSTSEKTFEALPLPVHGKPDSFTGAIGNFTIEQASITPNKVQVGEPVTLKFAILGKGNFDNISPPVLNFPEEWKTYAPKSEFTASDDYGYAGIKTFEYIIIPQSEAISFTPEVVFSAFDPKKGEYSEIFLNPLPLEVLPPSTQPVIAPPSPSFMHGSLDEKSKTAELLPIKLRVKGTVSTLRPLFLAPWFLAGQIMPLLLISFLFYFKRRQFILNQDTAYAQRIQTEKTIQKYLTQLHKGSTRKNSQLFYDVLQQIIRKMISKTCNFSSEALTLDEITSFLEGKKAPEALSIAIHQIFQAADVLKFSGEKTNQRLTSKNITQVEKFIKELEQWLASL